MNIHEEVKKRCEEFPLYSQESVHDPTVRAKLFFPAGAATWYITEYNPVTCVAFGYVVGLGTDEWGYISISELAKVRVAGVAVEVDLYFKPKRTSELGLPR